MALWLTARQTAKGPIIGRHKLDVYLVMHFGFHLEEFRHQPLQVT